MISIIVLTCDSHISKNFCLRHCLLSIFNQDYSNYEIIVIDNGCGLNRHTGGLVDNLSLTYFWVPIKCISMGGTVPRGKARNAGAKEANGDLFVFLDEDVILVDKEAIKSIKKFADEQLWGCGASRLWTKGDWFNLNAEQALMDISVGQFDSLFTNAGMPERFIRGAEDIRIETRTMIGHFGYCNKSAFDAVGGFEDIGVADSFDDDILNIKLFQEYGLPKLFPTLSVIHINHPIYGSRSVDFTFYFEYMVERGLFDFDSENLIFGMSETYIIVHLESVHYNKIVFDAYRHYVKGLPLNHVEMNEEQLEFWKGNMLLKIDNYCRVVADLLACDSVEGYILNHSTDYDNLAPILDSLLSTEIVRISERGDIQPVFNFEHRFRSRANENCAPSLNPRSEFNQFPCDFFSVERRVKLFRDRYPYCEFLRIGIVGDDDFFADRLKNDIWIQAIVIEKDPAILHYYAKAKNVKAIELDLLEIASDEFELIISGIPKVHTFITDPPYTLHGALSFIYSGLSLMEFDSQEKEFYMVMNPSIIGNSLIELMRVLAIAGIVIKDVVIAFNNYPFPQDYQETKRANNFNMENRIGGSSFSSTSNLYIFETIAPNLMFLRDYISNKLFYKHYEL